MKRKSRPGKGSILLIAMLLISSAGLRIWSGAGQALAKENALLAGTLSPNAAVLNTPKPESLAPMLRAFQEREARIDKQERQIALRMKGLEVADEQITKRIKHLEAAEQALRETLQLADGAAEKDIARLTTVYENMKPKTAAAVFEQMEPAFAAGFLGRMRPDAAAGIMAGLSPQIAYTISVILAGRNANVPKG